MPDLSPEALAKIRAESLLRNSTCKSCVVFDEHEQVKGGNKKAPGSSRCTSCSEKYRVSLQAPKTE